MFLEKTTTKLHPKVGKAMSLGVGHVDIAALSLTFHYQEQVKQDEVWQTVERSEPLVEGTHYSVDDAKGQITLLAHALWDQEGTWRAADRVEPLLYKDRVKHPQYVEAQFSYWKPAAVKLSVDKERIASDGTDATTVTVETDDPSVTEVAVAVMKGDKKIGTMTFPVGTQEITAEVTGEYRLQPDHEVKNADGNVEYMLDEEGKPIDLEVM